MGLSGLGIWIWQLALCERGDPAAIAAKAKRSGVSWVTVKSGDSRPNGQVTPQFVDALRMRASVDRDHSFRSAVITCFAVRDHLVVHGPMLGCIKARLRRNPADSRP
jgi:hypothetical protein